MYEAMKEMDERGVKFTMDDLARRLGVSKRTLYENFSSKEELIGSILADSIADLKTLREAIVNDPSLDVCEKFRRIMSVKPSLCAKTTDRVAIEMKKCMPEHWGKLEGAIDELWEITERLLQEGVQNGSFRPVFFPAMRAMFKGSFNEFANYSFLVQHKVTIDEMVGHMTDILMFGLVSGPETKEAQISRINSIHDRCKEEMT